MAEKIADTDIAREEGYLYFVKGNPLSIYKAKMRYYKLKEERQK